MLYIKMVWLILKYYKMKEDIRLDVFFVLEAPPGFEPGNRGFADLCLTTWPWRHITKDAFFSVFCVWSGRRDSNSRRSPWQGDALPLSHSRILVPSGGIEPPTQGFSVPSSTD